MDSTKVVLAVIGTLGVIFAAGTVWRWTSINRSRKASVFKVVSQKNNIAGGDIVAGNSAKTETKD